MRNPITALRYFFQKHNGPFDAAETERRNRERFNSLWMLDPDVLVRHLSAFAAGDICGLERVIEAFEERDDKMRVGSFKMAAAVASKPWEVRIAKGEEENDRARLHKDVLTRFWNRAQTTDAFCRNRRGGLRLLVKQMMSAQSRVFAVHDVSWQVLPGGELKATFAQVPAWCFENRSGRLRYIRSDGQYEGEDMADGEWLVTVGEGVGLTATILAMAKRLSWNDWLLFSEKCGMPVVMGNTSAQRNTAAWNAMARSIRAVAPKTGILADLDTRLQAVSMGGASSSSTYRELIDTVDRAISALYRGGDLATMSSGPDAAGVNAQSGESELMDADGCAMVAEALHDQIERRVIRFTCGDFEPLAGIYIGEPQKESVDTDMKIDQHLAGMGVKLSKTDALQRYNRAEAKGDDDALVLQQGAQPTAGLFNEKGHETLDERRDRPASEVSRPQAADDLAAVIADAMAAEFADALKPDTATAKNEADDDDVPDADDDLDEMEALANSIDANGMGHDDDNGQFDGSGSGGGSGGSAATPKHSSRKLPTTERSSIDDLIARESQAHADRLAKIKADIAAIRARRAEARKAGKKKLEGLKAKREQTRAEIMRMHVEAWKKRVAAQQATAKNKAPECRAEDPAHCRVHGTPEKRTLGEQLSELGYKDKADIEEQAKSVPADRISKIASGELKEHCKVHEAVAVLKTNPTVKNAFGNDVTFGEDMILKYLSGRERENNQPDVKRLKELPLAMFAVKHDKKPDYQFPRGTTPDYLKPPRGTQFVYSADVSGGTMLCRAWVDSGKVKGWYVE